MTPEPLKEQFQLDLDRLFGSADEETAPACDDPVAADEAGDIAGYTFYSGGLVNGAIQFGVDFAVAPRVKDIFDFEKLDQFPKKEQKLLMRLFQVFLMESRSHSDVAHRTLLAYGMLTDADTLTQKRASA